MKSLGFALRSTLLLCGEEGDQLLQARALHIVRQCGVKGFDSRAQVFGEQQLRRDSEWSRMKREEWRRRSARAGLRGESSGSSNR
jgi:hypothetical protein